MSFEVQLSRQQLVYSRYSSHPEKLLSSRGNFSKLLLQKSNELSETYIETRHLKSRDWTAVFITHFGSFRGKARWISEWREIISLVSAGIAQWLERSPPTSMIRIQFLPVPYVGWLSCMISLAPRVSIRVIRFSSLHKYQHSRKFQFHQNRTRIKTS